MKFDKDHPVALKGVALQPAVCACGHKGKSQRPEHYQCGGCYYEARADWTVKHAMKLRKRADKLMTDWARFRAKAAAFRKKHGGTTNEARAVQG